MVTVTTPLLPSVADMNVFGIFGLCLVVANTGLITWFLPWHPWDRTATLWLVPITYVFVADLAMRIRAWFGENALRMGRNPRSTS